MTGKTPLLVATALLALSLAPAWADDFSWNGGDNTWPSVNWTNVTTSASPVAGPTTGGNTATISAGTVTFSGNDTFGNDATASSPTITLGVGATLNSGGFFNTIWNLNLDGGTLLADGGAISIHQAFQLAGTLSVTGSQASTIGVAANPRNALNSISVGGAGNATLTLDVGDVTSDANADLTIDAVLKNRGSSTAGNLTKTGAGTAVLSAANVYTGQTLVTGGILEVATGGSVVGTNRVNALSGGELVIDGTVTVGNNGSFGIGTGASSAGTVTVNSGGTLNVGNGSGGTVGFAGIGGRFGSSGTAGQGTLTINDGGVVNIAAGGTGASSLDGTRFWLNPYVDGGSATINLNSGGLLSTARPISNGGGGTRPAFFFFDGGTLQAAGNTTLLMPQTNTITTRIKQGGAIIDTNGFDASITVALTDDSGATGTLTKQGAGTLTLSAANSFTGSTTVSAGALRITNATGLGTTAAGTTVADGAALELSGTITVGAEPLSLTGAGIASGGALRNVANNNTFGGLLTLAGPARINSDSGTLTLSNTGTITGSGFDLSLGGAGSVSLASIIGTGTGGLVKDGAGTATLSGLSTFTGDVTINAGTLVNSRQANNASPTASGLGDMTIEGRTVTVEPSAALTFDASDALGSFQYKTPVTMIAGGGTIQNGTSRFMSIGDIELRDGGTLNTQNGAADGFQAFNLRGSITVTGSSGSFITTTGSTRTGIHLGGTTIPATTFDVAATGDPTADLTVSAPMRDEVNAGPGSLIKTGAGTMALAVANSYTGGTTITAGVLEAVTGGLGPSGAVTMNGGTFRWATGNTDDLSGRLTLVNATTATLDTGSNDVLLAGGFGGSTTAGLTKTGTGTLTLGGTNTFTGPTTVTQGTLAVTGSIDAASVATIASGSTLTGTGTAGPTNVASGGTIVPGGAGGGTLSLGSLTFGATPGDSATVAIGVASNAPASSIAVTGDVVTNGSAGSVALLLGPDLLLIPSGTYPLITYTGTQLADVSAFAATGTVGARQGVSIGNGTGAINLEITNAWPIWKGDVNSGWSTTDNWVLNTTSAPTSFIADDTVFFSDGADTGTVEITQNVNPTITTFDAAALDYTLSSSGSFGITTGSVLKSGAAMVTIANDNAYSGGTTLSAGRLRAGSDTALGTGTVTFAGGSLSAASATSRSLANAILFNADATIGDAVDAGSLQFSGAVDLGGITRTLTIDSDVSFTGVASNGGLTKSGSATLTLAAANSFSGPARVIAGTLALSGSGTIGDGTSALALDGGRLDLGGTSQSAGAVTISTAAVAGDTITSGTLSASSYAVSNSTGNVTIAAALAGAANFTKTGAGTTVLSAANVYTGPTLVSGGILEVAAGGSVIGTNLVNALSGGELVIDGTVTVGNNGSFAVGTGESSAGTVTVNSGGTLNVGNGSGSTVGFAAIGGAFAFGGTAGQGTLTINDGGVVNVAAGGTGASSLDGTRFWLNAYAAGGSATINLNSGGLLSTARPISNGGSGDRPASFFFDGGTLQAAGNTTLLMPQTNTITTQIKQGGAIIDTNGFDASITVALTDDFGAAGTLTKQGAGTLTLSAANSFTGNTTISAGTLALAVAGTFENTAMVSLAGGSGLDLTSKTAGFSFGTGQTLAGTGLVSLGANRDLTILGSLAPGQSPGTLSLDGNLVLGSASTSLFEIDGVTNGLYDLVQESGGSRGVTFGGSLSLAFASDWSTETTLKLFDFTTYSGSFSQVQTTGLASGYTASFNELTGEVVVVPEPGFAAAAIAALAAGIGLAARRRRQPS